MFTAEMDLIGQRQMIPDIRICAEYYSTVLYGTGGGRAMCCCTGVLHSQPYYSPALLLSMTTPKTKDDKLLSFRSNVLR